MGMRYDPTAIPPELEPFGSGISDLDYGPNHCTCLFRLVYFWRDPDDLPNYVEPSLYTQWIDINETRVEGFIAPNQAREALTLLIVGTIYKFDRPTLIPARTMLRSCPGVSMLVVYPECLLYPVYEIPTKPFFPREVFSIVPAANLSSRHTSRMTTSDIIGRLVSMTDPVPTSDGALAFTVVVDDPCLYRVSVRYLRYIPPQGFSIQSIAAIESMRHVLCILTCVVVCDPPGLQGELLSLEATPASRLIFPTYHHPFRRVVDIFAHRHLPVQLVSPTSSQSYTFIRGALPRKLPLSALLLEPGTTPAETEEPFWCMVHIADVEHHVDNIVYAGKRPKYGVVVRCADATTAVNFLFPSPAANLLLKMCPHEFVALPCDAESALLKSLLDRNFIIEARSGRDESTPRAQFVVTNLFDPVAAFY